LASSTPVLTSSAVTTANAPSAWTSPVDQARGWVAYTSRVPTGWSASRTGTLNTPRQPNDPRPPNDVLGCYADHPVATATVHGTRAMLLRCPIGSALNSGHTLVR
jgi:hypothetical protein